MMSLIIRYVVSVIYYEPYIYGDHNPSVWFRDNGKVSEKNPHVNHQNSAKYKFEML